MINRRVNTPKADFHITENKDKCLIASNPDSEADNLEIGTPGAIMAICPQDTLPRVQAGPRGQTFRQGGRAYSVQIDFGWQYAVYGGMTQQMLCERYNLNFRGDKLPLPTGILGMVGLSCKDPDVADWLRRTE